MFAVADPIIRPSDIKPYTGLSRATVYRKIARKEFPATIPLSDGAVGWPLSVINNWRVSRGLPPTGTSVQLPQPA
jgi:predicted DNA-binding transcriptional regulator AlpA